MHDERAEIYIAVNIKEFQFHTSIMAPMTTNESYCTFSLSSDLTAGGLPSEEEIAKDLESNDAKVGCT